MPRKLPKIEHTDAQKIADANVSHGSDASNWTSGAEEASPEHGKC